LLLLLLLYYSDVQKGIGNVRHRRYIIAMKRKSIISKKNIF